MALDKEALKEDLKAIFINLTDSVSNKEGLMEVAIDKYLDTAEVGTLGSSVTFVPISISFPVNSTTLGIFEEMLTTAVALACASPVGNLDGIPVAPLVKITAEVGIPPTASVEFTMSLESVDDSAQRMADAIHTSVSTIIFNTIQLAPPPANTPTPGPFPIT